VSQTKRILRPALHLTERTLGDQLAHTAAGDTFVRSLERGRDLPPDVDLVRLAIGGLPGSTQSCP